MESLRSRGKEGAKITRARNFKEVGCCSRIRPRVEHQQKGLERNGDLKKKPLGDLQVHITRT